jgi:hypothetical protein
MTSLRGSGCLLLSSLLLTFLAPSADATSVRQFGLGGLCQNAHRIFRGVVVDVNPGTVEAGGGRIPTVTYRIKVNETLHGPQMGIIDLTMVTDPKEGQIEGNMKRFPLFRDVPKLEKGGEYLLFTTAPSRIGLSTTVGLGQGCFQILSQNKKDVAVNGANNAGLGLASAGPADYSVLTARIRTLLNH